jgi:beta-lactamase superfamily II metal-dependent hydrolase
MAKLIQYSTLASQYNGAFDSNVGWAAAGMGYLIVTDNGRLIMIDGGFDEDAEPIISLMRDYSGQKIPTVDLWIITHPHGDHYFALRRIAKDDIRNMLCIKTLSYYFPDGFSDRGGNTCLADAREIQRVSDAFGTDIIIPEIDGHIEIDGLDIHFLYVPKDTSELNNFNQLSLIFKVTGNGKSLLITGDAFHRNLQTVVDNYGDGLRSDILQMPHHGLCDTGHIEFYRLADARTVLIPTSIAGYRAMHSDMYSIESRQANLFAEEKAESVFKSCDGTVELDI